MGSNHSKLAEISRMASEAMQRKDYDQCIDLLKQASRLAPTNWNILIDIARILVSRYEFNASDKYFEKAIKLSNNEPSVCAIAVPCYFNARQYDMAIKYLNRLLKCNPNAIETLTYLATIYEHQGRQLLAGECVDQVMRLDSGYKPALLIKAKLSRKNGQHAEAENLLRKIASIGNKEVNLCAEAWCELGKLLDGQGRFEEAFESFTNAKAMLLPHCTQFLDNRRRTQVHSRMMGDHFTPETSKRWLEEGSAHRPQHRIALLAGHPRSGTTLLEQILDAHPGIVSIEETSIFFNEAYLPIIHNLPLDKHLQAIDRASMHQIAASRTVYFQLVERFCGKGIGESMLIDKNPSLTQFVHAFGRIFPESKFLIALRDPRDVCLSCFMQFLPICPVASTYLTLQDTVDEYLSVMQSWQNFKAKSQNPYLEIRYEDVVNDVKYHAQRTLEFLDIPWDAQVLHFDQHARAKTVHSPTHADVVKPIYTGAVGRWKNYKRHLEPYLQQLEPLVKAFGYE